MRLPIIHFFTLLRELFSIFFSEVTSAIPLANNRVFTFAEANFSIIFTDAGIFGQYQQYLYRYYSAMGNMVGIFLNYPS